VFFWVRYKAQTCANEFLGAEPIFFVLRMPLMLATDVLSEALEVPPNESNCNDCC
jgi:hypothetical protein